MTEEKKDDDLKVVVAEDGSATVGGETSPAEEHKDEGGGDTRLNGEGTGEDDGQEEQGHAEETAEEAEERKKRNRERRQQSKENRRTYIESLKRELASRDAAINEMNQRLALVERKSTGSEMAQLEHAEREAMGYYNHFKQLNSKAIEDANGALANDAMEKMFIAKQRIDQIANIKKALSQRQTQPAPLDPRIQSHAESWMERNSWYDPNGNDDDSAVVLSIDQRLAKSWDPTTPQYWEELDSQVKKYLPHRTKTGHNSQQGAGNTSARSPVAGSGRESSSGKSTTGYKLSADRVQAIKDAGNWDDPVKRATAIRYFQQYDKENAA